MPRKVHFGAMLLALLFATVQGHAQFKPAPQPYGQPAYSGAAQPDPYGGGQEPMDDPQAAADQQHGVARLSVLLGEVGIRRGDTSELIAAVPNAPLQKGDSVQTSRTGAAEVEIDAANVVRVAENSEIGFSDLQFRRVQIQLTAGSALYRILGPSGTEVEIDTPSVAVRPVGVSAMRITILDGGITRISMYLGSAEMRGPQGSEPLQAGTTVLVRMGPSGPEFQQTGSLPQDQFDAWSSSRDQDLLNSQSAQMVGPEMSGTQDLDRTGSWVPSPYGQVWEPRDMGPDWAPYSNGEWAWQSYYGWTWIDYAPWGWAPYHYGRWFRNGTYGWCWWPGPRGGLRVWRPALVGFFGSGRGLGWVALAPHEGFQAWWGRRNWIGGNRYGGGAIRYQNAAFRGAALYVSRDNFSGPHQRFGWATSEQLRTASRFDGQLPVTPNRSSYRFSEQSIVPNTGRVYTGGARQQSGFSVVPRSSYSRPTQSTLANGWQRFGDPGSQRNSDRGSFTVTPRSESGWHQFGRPPSNSPESNRSFAKPSPPVMSSGSGWRSFGSRPTPQAYQQPAYPGTSGREPRYNAPEQRYQPPSAPSAMRESYRGSGGGGYNRGPAQNTPNRGAGDHGGGGGRPSGGGGGHSRR